MTKVLVHKINTLTGHKDCIYTVEKSGEDHIFFSGAGDGFVVAWDLNQPENGQVVAQVPSSVYALHYAKQENALIIGQNFFGLNVIDLHNNKQKNMVRFTSVAIFDVKSHQKKIFTATGDGAITVLNIEDLKIIHQIKASTKSARSIAVNPEKQEMAVGFSDHVIRIYDINNFQLKKEIREHKNSVFSIVYSPDGRYLLSTGRDANLKFWSVDEEYEKAESIVAHIYAINHIDYRSDGKYFVTGSMDKSIKVWDASNFRLLKVIDKARHEGHNSSVNKLFWSGHQDQLVSCSDDRTISVWDLKFKDEL